MAWIESHASLYEHAKTRKAARILGVSVPTVMGHLHCLWHWALTHSEDGDLSGLDHEDIAYAAKWEDDPEEFVRALTDCGKRPGAGFLDRDGDDLSIHGWSGYAGRLMAKREASRERARSSRARARSVRAGAPIQDRTGPNRTTPNPTQPEEPPPAPPGGTGLEVGTALNSDSPDAAGEPDHGHDEFEAGWSAQRDAGASLGSKRTKTGNCAWRQWGRLLAQSGLSPADALARWQRRVLARGEFTEQPQRLLRPENCFLTDEALEDIEASVRARGGKVSEAAGDKQRDRKRIELEGKHNHLEGCIREAGPRPDLVQRLNRYRELLGWEPKRFGEWTGGDQGGDNELLKRVARLSDGKRA